MRPADDDGAETGGGPPPDPSLRSWRHPSEIAAAAAAAAAAANQSNHRELLDSPERPATTLAGRSAIIGAAAAVAVLAALTIGSTVAFRTDTGPSAGFASQAVASRAAVVPPAPHAAQPDDGRRDTESTVDGNDNDQPLDRTAAEPPGTDDQQGTTTSTSAQKPVDEAKPTTSAPTDQAVGVPTLDWFTDPAMLDAAATGDGVYGFDDGEIVRLASFMVVDGMFLTSSSAIDGQRDLALLSGDASASATVVGSDGITDVAVLTVPTAEADAILAEVPLSWTSPSPVSAAPGTEVRIAPGSDLDAVGITIGTVHRTTVSDGSPVFEVVLTTAHRPEGASGSVVVNANGAPIGMVIDTPGYLTRIIPMAEAVSVGQSFLDWGSPAAEWLGIEGFSNEAGGVEVRAVESASPADSAGIMAGDVIATLGGESVSDWHHLVHLIRTAGAGQATTIEIVRADEPTALVAVIGSRAETTDP